MLKFANCTKHKGLLWLMKIYFAVHNKILEKKNFRLDYGVSRQVRGITMIAINPEENEMQFTAKRSVVLNFICKENNQLTDKSKLSCHCQVSAWLKINFIWIYIPL